MDLNMDLKTAVTLSPRLIQSMSILQMGSMELMDYINESMNENPLLELDEAQAGPEEADKLRLKLEWLAKKELRERAVSAPDDEELDPLERLTPAAEPGESLYEHLMGQLRTMRLDKTTLKTAAGIIASLNRQGYLDEPDDEVARRLDADGALFQKALAVVQSLEPTGVGARDLSECLCLQLAAMGEKGLPYRIAEKYLAALSKNHYNHIARMLDVDVAAVRAACEVIRTLDPKPGSVYSADTDPGYLVPDLTVRLSPEGPELASNDFFFPSLRLSGYYRSLAKESDDPEVRDYLGEKIRQAKWVLSNVEHRRTTLMRVAEFIVGRQEPFFRLGPGHLRPLSLADAADRLGLHASTVSRAVKDKYLECAFGVFPLSFFFSRALDGGEAAAVSADRAKSLLAELIAGEDREKPLSDQKLSALLSEKGVEISRRTVAKYRGELGLQSAAGRREA